MWNGRLALEVNKLAILGGDTEVVRYTVQKIERKKTRRKKVGYRMRSTLGGGHVFGE